MGAPVCGSHLPEVMLKRTLHTARTSALMNPTSANFRSRWEGAGFCSRCSDWPLLSCAKPSLVRLFLAVETAALQTGPRMAVPGSWPPPARWNPAPAPGSRASEGEERPTHAGPLSPADILQGFPDFASGILPAKPDTSAPCFGPESGRSRRQRPRQLPTPEALGRHGPVRPAPGPMGRAPLTPPQPGQLLRPDAVVQEAETARGPADVPHSLLPRHLGKLCPNLYPAHRDPDGGR